MVFQEHKVMLCLDKPIYTAFIRLQADMGLGRAYAGLLPYVEGLYTMGFLSKEDYVKYRTRYSEKLVKDKPKAKGPKCSFCDQPSVGKFENVSGVQKFACSRHAEQLRAHEKWQELPA